MELRQMNNLIIRKEEKADQKRVQEVIRLAFEKEEFSDKDEHNLVKRLRKSKAFVPELSMVAELDGQIVGHILFTEICIGEQKALALAPVSVLPEYQGLGMGSKLIEKGHEIAGKLGYQVSLVLGHEKYYPKFGYITASQFGIKAPFDVADENFMVVELQKGALGKFRGTVVYAPEFNI
jgi:predicted N-acetyltransferase YhbS